MLKILEAWLEKPSERYSDGVTIFEQLAPADIKKKYIDFFKEVSQPKQSDIHFSMLINKVGAIYLKVKSNPKAFENVELIFKETGPDADTQALIEEKNKKIEVLRVKLEVLKSDNVDLISENENLSDNVETLETDLEDANQAIEDYESQISQLESDIEILKAKRGLQIVAFKDLPEELQRKFERNREITPIMANLHAQISVEGLNGNTRKSLIKKLTTFDDERRANWDEINDWSEGKTLAEDVVVEVPEFSADPLVAGVQIARRIERLKENISRSQTVLESSEKETIKANAEKRIAMYSAELAELEAKISEKQEV